MYSSAQIPSLAGDNLRFLSWGVHSDDPLHALLLHVLSEQHGQSIRLCPCQSTVPLNVPPHAEGQLQHTSLERSEPCILNSCFCEKSRALPYPIPPQRKFISSNQTKMPSSRPFIYWTFARRTISYL